MERQGRVSAELLRSKIIIFNFCVNMPYVFEFYLAFEDNIILKIIPRVLNTGGNYGGIVILCQFLIAAVHDRFVPGILRHSGFEIVRDQQPCHAAEVFVSMDVAAQPVFKLHVGSGFRIDITTARQNSDEQVCRCALTGYGIVDGKRIAGSIHLHCVSGFMLDPHCCLGDPCPSTIFVAELRGHVRLFAVGICLFAIFLPKKSERHAFLG